MNANRLSLIRSRLALAGEALGEEDFEQGLIGHVAAIREYLQVLDHGKRQAQGDGLESGLEADEFCALAEDQSRYSVESAVAQKFRSWSSVLNSGSFFLVILCLTPSVGRRCLRCDSRLLA